MSNQSEAPHPATVAIIGGGPAGLMAAQVLADAGIAVDIYEAKGSVGRKFLIAGKGGLNLTHSDPFDLFVSRYRERADWVGDWLGDFDADALRAWAKDRGVDTYVGSSGRIFPIDRKAAPLLRGWVKELKARGVGFNVNHRWLGWDATGALRIVCGDTEHTVHPVATVLALGGASWPQLGSDGAWVPLLAGRGIELAPLQPANCGFDIGWSEHFVQRHAGAPLKPVVAHWQDRDGKSHSLQGECVISADGIEGSLIYAMAADLRESLNLHGQCTLELDLAPGRTHDRLLTDLGKPRGKRSFGEHLRRQSGLDAVKSALVFEMLGKQAGDRLDLLVDTIKHLPLKLLRPRPVAEAISTAGGVSPEAVDDNLMLKQLPGVFCAGEMLDWEAPTGGYLLTACFASGYRASHGVLNWLQRQQAD